MNSKLSERLNVFPAGVWVSAAGWERFLGVAYVENADGAETVTAQLRKATDASGTNAANFGSATVTTLSGSSPADDETIKAAADGKADQLGRTAGGVQFTHVSLLVSDGSSPETGTGVLIVGDARYSKDTLAGLGLAETNTTDL